MQQQCIIVCVRVCVHKYKIITYDVLTARQHSKISEKNSVHQHEKTASDFGTLNN